MALKLLWAGKEETAADELSEAFNGSQENLTALVDIGSTRDPVRFLPCST